MPSPWKKARLGGISRLLVSSLRSNAKRGVGDSPLVVQAGFPTSLADFLVKNRSRLGKPPRWRCKPRPATPTADAGCSTMAALTAEIIAAATDSDYRLPTGPGSPPPEVDDRRQPSPVAGKCGDPESLIRADAPKNEALHGLLGSQLSNGDAGFPLPKVEGFEGLRGPRATGDGANRGIPGSKAEKDEMSPSSAQPKLPSTRPRPLESSPTAEARKGGPSGAPSAPEEAERKVLGGVGGRVFMVATKVVFVVVILAVVSKKIAAAVSVSVFAFLFAESIGRRLVPLLGPCEESKKSLGAIVGGAAASDLAQTPPDQLNFHCWGRIPALLASIAEPDLGSFGSERNSIVEGPINAVETASLALLEKDCVEIGGGRANQGAATTNGRKKKKRKLFRNFVPIKFRGSKGVKGGKMEGKLAPASDSGGGGVPGQRGIWEEALEEEVEEEDDDGNRRGVNNEQKYGEEGEREEGGGGLGLQILAIAHDVGLGAAASVGTKVGEPGKRSSEYLVFFVIVLAGLIGGRVVALVLAVLWYSLVSSARSLWRSWNSHRNLGAVPDVSTSKALSTGGGE